MDNLAVTIRWLSLTPDPFDQFPQLQALAEDPSIAMCIANAVAELRARIAALEAQVRELEAECERQRERLRDTDMRNVELQCRIEQRVALRREVEEIAGVATGPAGDDQFEAGVAGLRALKARAESAEAALTAAEKRNETLRELADMSAWESGDYARRMGEAQSALAAAREENEVLRGRIKRAQERLDMDPVGNPNYLALSADLRGEIGRVGGVPQYDSGAALRSRADGAGSDNPAAHMVPGNGLDGNDTVFMWRVRSRADDAGRVERVARWFSRNHWRSFDSASQDERDGYTDLARAVLAAADGREP